MATFEVVMPRNGEVMNRHDGTEMPDGLHITLIGRCPAGAAVTVDGKPVPVAGQAFSAAVVLSKPRNEIVVTCGDESRTLVLLYDRRSFPRFRFSVDDVIWCFTEVTRRQGEYASLFDHWFFGVWKELHDKYGVKTQMNIYLEDPKADFHLSQFPDRYRGEWQDNAEWFRLSFHALDNNCYDNAIYRNTTEEQLKADYEAVANEVLRFAGEGVFCRDYTTLHWAETNPAGARALRAMGTRGLTGRFGTNQAGKIWSTHYHLDDDTTRHAGGRNLWYDVDTDLYFVNVPQFLNNVRLPLLTWHYDRLLEGKGGAQPFDVIDFLVHEEQFWTGFMGGKGYLPESRERVHIAALWALESGLKPVCFEEGIAGNVWE